MSVTKIQSFRPTEFDQLTRRQSLELRRKIVEVSVKNGYKEFCYGTSVHGFMELYNAKSKLSIFLWVTFISAAFALSGFQVYNATMQYVNQDSSSTIDPAKNSEVIYPPLKICLPHWLLWFDWQKANDQGFTNDVILYAMSCLGYVFSSNTFDISAAEQNFSKAMSSNNLQSKTAFYKSFVRPIGNFIKMMRTSRNYQIVQMDPQEIFKHMEVKENEMCFSADGSAVKSFIESENRIAKTNRGNNLIMQVYQPFVDVSDDEYNSYMAKWIDENKFQYDFKEDDIFSLNFNSFGTVRGDYKEVKIPVKLFVNGYSADPSVELVAEVDTYLITVKASAHVWKSTSEKSCLSDIPYIELNSSCTSECIEKACNKEGKDSMDYFTFNDINLKCFERRIVFVQSPENSATTIDQQTFPDQGLPAEDLNTTTTDVGENTTQSIKTALRKQRDVDDVKFAVAPIAWTGDVPKTTPAFDAIITYEEIKKNCSHQCLQGCAKWSYDISVTSSLIPALIKITKKVSTKVQIVYPVDGETLIVTETDKQSWDNFVGNVGGIVGVWTGASILSLIQLFYLCCFYRANE